ESRGHDGRPEYLVQWSVVSSAEKAAGGSSASSAESKAEHISMWMSAEEVCASCPALPGRRRATSPAPPLEPSPGNLEFLKLRDAAATFPFAGSTSSKAECPPWSTDTRRTLTHLRHSHKHKHSQPRPLLLLVQQRQKVTPASTHCTFQVHKYTHMDPLGSRAYVLLSLSRQDGIEQHMDFDSRCTLLELFAEITSSAEHCMSFEGIHLPQV
ncbi:Cullin-9, partial [Corvus brachyrhynchos]